MKDLIASEVMTRPVISARENTSARDIALQLLNGLYSGMPVTGKDGQVVGIITEMDILNAVNDGAELVRTTASDIMTRDTVTAKPDSSLTEIISMMKELNIIRVPIVKDDKLIGIVSRGDILKNLMEPEFVVNR